VKRLTTFRPRWVMAPDLIPETSINFPKHRILRYPGIKEDVYVPRFHPDPSIRSSLGLTDDELVVTVRPPANEAHYYNPKSDVLYHAAMDFLGKAPNVRVVLVPRNEKQGDSARQLWPILFESRKFMIPDHVVDGLNLMWFSDLVISGGGTMNREAAALGVPVYSIFRGTIGAVDRYLSEAGRLVLLEKAEDLPDKINLCRWERPETPRKGQSSTLTTIVENIVSVVESQRQAQSRVAR
jgi:predicted glycosyltransferase